MRNEYYTIIIYDLNNDWMLYDCNNDCNKNLKQIFETEKITTGKNYDNYIIICKGNNSFLK